MGNTTKTESSYEYNQDNFNFIITCNSNNSIMSESYQDNIQRTSDNNNSLQYDLEFTILYKLRCEYRRDIWVCMVLVCKYNYVILFNYHFGFFAG